MLEYNLRARTALNRYFTGWLDHHAKQREKWQSLIKYRYLLSRSRLNKMFWAWKLAVRRRKVNRLKASIVEHTRYQNGMRACFRGWATSLRMTNESLRKVSAICDRRIKKIVLHYIRYLQHDKEFKLNNIQVAKDHNLSQILIKAYRSFKLNVS
jgi:hypothetical protein